MLTDNHRRSQVILGSRVADQTMQLLVNAGSGLPLEDLLTVQAAGHAESAQMAVDYLQRFRQAEWGTDSLSVELASFDRDAAARNLGDILAQYGRGVGPFATWEQVVAAIASLAANTAMWGGRSTIIKSARRARSSWRRVTDGDPCAFCAMLASRGPVYSRNTVLTTKTGESYHWHCGCSLEEFRGDWDDWVPSLQEQRFIDLYDRASRQVHGTKDILGTMRSLGQGIVGDASKPPTD